MSTLRIVRSLLLAAGLVVGCKSDVVEHQPDPQKTADDGELTKLAFDKAKVETRAGSVVKVEPFQKISGSRHGLRIQLKSGDDVYHVYLGPERYLEREGLSLKPGAEVEVVGSVLDGDGRPVIIASSVTSRQTTVTLRDEDGRPAWRRWKRWRKS